MDTPRGFQIALLGGLVLLAMFNLTLVSPILPELIAERFDLGDLAIGAFTSAEMAAYVVFAPVWGALSDRWGVRRPLVILGLGASAPLFAIMPHVGSYLVLVALRFVQGAFTVAAWSVAMTMALDLAGSADRGRTMGVLGAGMMLGMALGAPVGGTVADRWGVAGPFNVAAVVFGTALMLGAALLRETPARSRAPPTPGASRPGEGWMRALWVPGAYSFVERFTAGFFITLFPAMLLESFGLSPGARGMFLGLFFLPFAIFQLPYGRLTDRLGPVPFLVGGSVVYGTLMVLVPRLDQGPLAAAMFSLGSLAAAMLPASLVLVGQMAPPGAHGLAMGAFNAAGSVGFAIGLLASGGLSGLWGQQSAFAVGGVSVLAVAAVTLFPLLHLGGHAGQAERATPP